MKQLKNGDVEFDSKLEVEDYLHSLPQIWIDQSHVSQTTPYVIAYIIYPGMYHGFGNKYGVKNNHQERLIVFSTPTELEKGYFLASKYSDVRFTYFEKTVKESENGILFEDYKKTELTDYGLKLLKDQLTDYDTSKESLLENLKAGLYQDTVYELKTDIDNFKDHFNQALNELIYAVKHHYPTSQRFDYYDETGATLRIGNGSYLPFMDNIMFHDQVSFLEEDRENPLDTIAIDNIVFYFEEEGEIEVEDTTLYELMTNKEEWFDSIQEWFQKTIKRHEQYQ